MIQTPNGTVDEVPLFEEQEAKTEYINYCFTVEQPALLINMVRGRTWCFVECDMLPTGGRDPYPQNRRKALTTDAVEQVNSICEVFEDEELRNSLSMGALSTAPGAGFMSFPDMRPDVARRFAERIKPIVMDEENWEEALD